MAINSTKNGKEKLFDELIDVKLLHEQKVKEIESLAKDSKDYSSVENQLIKLDEKINAIQKAVAQYGDSFLDVYDAQLLNPLSETDVIHLREEINNIRQRLELVSNREP